VWVVKGPHTEEVEAALGAQAVPPAAAEVL
jgi:hypothetical protein